MSSIVSQQPHSSGTPSPSPGTAAGKPPKGSILRRFSGLGFLAAMVAAWWWLSTHHFGGVQNPSHGPNDASSVGQGTGAEKPSGGIAIPAVVTLPASAQSAAEIGLTDAMVQPLRKHLTVPGRIDYDARRRLDYASPVDGIVSKVLVNVRQKVSKGDALAELSSPDVGTARDDVRRREDDRQIEKKAAEWATTIADNVESLLDVVASHPPLADIEKQFQDRLLGSYREKILGSYSRLIYVEKVNAGTKSLGEGGVLSGRIVEERASNLEVAAANFRAACEEARFLTHQDRDRARASLAQADRLVQISRENLRTLVGSRLEADPTDVEPGESPGESGSLSALVLRSPFDGIVEDVFIARGERARVGDKLFVVADTSTLWVRAQIHERQWTAVEVSAGQPVRVVVPGADVHETTAVVNHVGATVESESRSVPLVAELKNTDAHFKPGMFVWVDLPQGELREALAVPASAVLRHEGKSFVFVPDGPDRFRRVDVITGVESGDLLEVTSGLSVGQQVVSRGAFVLKSELLLDKEAE
jgi:cobalt-zinc-cadmium efflux system membrane fusion protein